MSDPLNEPRLSIEDIAIGGRIVTVLVCRRAGKSERIFGLAEMNRDGLTMVTPSITEAREAFAEQSRDV